MDLTLIDEKELRAEIDRRRVLAEELAKQKRIELVKLAIKHRDVLALFLSHDRTSCKSTNNACYHPNHGVADCNLCALMDLQEYMDDIDISFSLTQLDIINQPVTLTDPQDNNSHYNVTNLVKESDGHFSMHQI